MKVIYDISPVGNLPQSRTGLARTAWSTALSLRERLGDDLCFSACGSIDASLEAEALLREHPGLNFVANPVSHLARRVHFFDAKLAQWQTKGALWQLFKKNTRKTAINTLRALNLMRQPIVDSFLSEADVFHSSYARIPGQVRKALPHRHALTVYDLTPLILPETYFVPGQRAITRRIIDSIQVNDWVMTISNSTRNDLCERSQVDPDRVVTVYLAADRHIFAPDADAQHIAQVRRKYRIPEGNYLLTLHSLAPHKNLGHLIRCFYKLQQQERIDSVHLVVVGGQSELARQEAEAQQLAGADAQGIYFTGYVPDEDLAALYSGAVAFVFPSLYEGFGLPVLEAMQCGCATISSNSGSLPEIVGDAGLLVTPTDVDGLCQAMLEFCNDAEVRAEYSLRGINRAANFSWQRTAEQILSVYDLIVEHS